MPRKFIFFQFFKNVKHVFSNVLIMIEEHVKYSTTEESSAERAVMCR
jgi:hypothetical protein